MNFRKLCLIGSLAALPGATLANNYTDTWGPPVGATAPALLAEDQAGSPRDLKSLAGHNGLLLVLSRSADW